jgi:hypothetical protein
MPRITAVSIERDGQSWEGFPINAQTEALALALVGQRLKFEMLSPRGRVTRVEFTYEDDLDA